MGRLGHFDAFAGKAVTIAGDHEAGHGPGPGLLDGPGHGGGRLAGADDHGTAPGWRRQVRGQAAGRIGGGHGRVEQAAQEVAGISYRHGESQPSPASVVAAGMYSQPIQPA